MFEGKDGLESLQTAGVQDSLSLLFTWHLTQVIDLVSPLWNIGPVTVTGIGKHDAQCATYSVQKWHNEGTSRWGRRAGKRVGEK